MIRDVVRYPDPLLFEKTAEVEKITDTERTLIQDMIDTMHAERGVGIGANQIGVSKSIFIACPEAKRGTETVFINPRITKRSGSVSDTEGCLSIPGMTENVKRSRKVTVVAQDIDGKVFTVEGEDFLARIYQHEIDHLEGMLYFQRLSFFKRKHFLKRLTAALS